MADRPITIIAPTIGRVLDGTCTVLRRPFGAFDVCQSGDRLWIREPFRLRIGLDHISPLQALERSAAPAFSIDASDMVQRGDAQLGRPRFVRELPRAWHRAHLIVKSVWREQLHAISDAEITAAGFASRGQFAAQWDAGARMGRWSNRWECNPEILVLAVRCVRAPLPGPHQPERICA